MTDRFTAAEIASLTLSAPLPLTAHPAAVYLSQLSPKSRVIITRVLNWIARTLTGGACDYLTLDWAKLRYQHAAALRAIVLEVNAPATANLKLTAFKQVLRAARKLKQIAPDDFESAIDLPPVRGDSPERGRLLQSEEISLLLGACKQGQTPIGIRDAAMIAVLCAGLRRSEVVGLDFDDFDPKMGGLLVRKGKGNKSRTAYLPDGVDALLTDWLEVRGNKPGPLFCHVRNGKVSLDRLTDQALVNRLECRASQVGSDVKAFSSHDFRRTFISTLLDAGADIVTVQKLAGHSNPATTAKYDRRGEATRQRAAKLLRVRTYT